MTLSVLFQIQLDNYALCLLFSNPEVSSVTGL